VKFPLEVVGASKKKITEIIHIKYVDIMDLKTKTDDLDGNISKNYAVLKKTALKTCWTTERGGESIVTVLKQLYPFLNSLQNSQ
jgi:hypothetical protein